MSWFRMRSFLIRLGRCRGNEDSGGCPINFQLYYFINKNQLILQVRFSFICYNTLETIPDEKN